MIKILLHMKHLRTKIPPEKIFIGAVALGDLISNSSEIPFAHNFFHG